MKRPILRVPTRDARDADHLAIIAIAGGIFLWWGRVGLPGTTAPWIACIAIASVLCGILLWLRVPAIKWLGVLVFVALSGISVRALMIKGWSVGSVINVVLPLLPAFWMGRIDYNHRFEDDEDSASA